MKKNWYATYESIKGPLVMYFSALILLAIPNIITTDVEIISTILLACKYAGGLIKTLFPLFMIINIIGKYHEDSIPVLGGVISYLLLHLVTMFMARQDFDPVYYTSLGSGLLESASVLGKRPINMGLIASLIVILIVVFTYRLSRQRFNYGLMTFIDNDSWFMIICNVLTIVVGILISLLFPYVINLVNIVMTFISHNSNNPAALFVYGLSERLLELFDLEEIVHNGFWFGNFGGNWMDATGTVFTGDVNIWTAQLTRGTVELGVGKYITPYYIINMFIVPALIIGIYSQFSSKIERRRLLGLGIVGIAVSFTAGTLVPLQLMLLFVSPTLLVMHIIRSSSLYMIFSILEIYLGYFYADALAFATPGTIMEFSRMAGLLSANGLRNIILIGVGYAVLYIVMVLVYFNFMAQDFLDKENSVMRRKELIRALGGIGNIRVVDGSPLSLSVAVNDTNKIKAAPIMDLGAYKITESFYYHRIFFGPGSVALARKIRKDIKEYDGVLKYIEAK